MCSWILLASILLKIFVSMFISKIAGGCSMWSATELRVRLGIVFGWEDQGVNVWRSLTYFPVKYHLLFFMVKLFKIFWQFWNVYFVGCWDKIFSKWNFKKYFFFSQFLGSVRFDRESLCGKRLRQLATLHKHSQSIERSEWFWSLIFPPFTQYRNPTHKMVIPRIRISLPILVNPM